MTFLVLNDVSKFYGTQCAVENLSLSVEKGEFVSLLGPSGCGKTSTLQMIAGFESVSSGSIVLAGRDITKAKANSRGLGIVFQSYALFPHMTVEGNVAFGLQMRHVAKAERHERVRQALALVHLQAFIDRYPRELSGGQRQRVALARALVIAPPVLLLDEPLSNLDAKLREEMQLELRQIQREVGTTTVMVTHDQSEAMSISDRVVVMKAGRATQIGQPLTVYEHPNDRFISTFVGRTNLLQGRVLEGGHRVVLHPHAVELDVETIGFSPGSEVLLSLRPEKLLLQPAGQGKLPARLQERYFLGSQWLYRVDTPLGVLEVVVPNDGRTSLAIGAEASIDWQPHSMRLMPAEDEGSSSRVSA